MFLFSAKRSWNPRQTMSQERDHNIVKATFGALVIQYKEWKVTFSQVIVIYK